MNFYTKEELEIASRPEMQEYFREMMGEWQEGDRYYNPAIRKVHVVTMRWWSPCVDACYLPYPLDPQDTERLAKGENPRGLLGMVDTFVSLGQQAKDSWEIVTYEVVLEGSTPTLALLKAIAHQIGVEVK